MPASLQQRDSVQSSPEAEQGTGLREAVVLRV
jgi:hypothetical protein